MDKQRESNIELLRICTMSGVILLHYNNPGIGGAFNHAQGIDCEYKEIRGIECKDRSLEQ